MADLNTDIRYIKGVGEARAKAFEKLGVFTGTCRRGSTPAARP